MKRICEIIRRQRFVIEDGCHLRDSLIVVLEGSFFCKIGDEQFVARRGSACVFPRGVMFQRKVMEPVRCIHIQFENFPAKLKTGMLDFPDLQRAESTMEYLAAAVEKKEEDRIAHYLQDLIYLQQPTKTKPDIRDPLVRRCMDYIHEIFCRSVSLAELASYVGLSKQSLIRKFKESTAMTPMQYLAATRLNESMILLRDTDLPVNQIAQQCGFETACYFCNVFRKSTGVSPSAYRKQSGL